MGGLSMGPWWTRDESGKLESLDEGWLARRLHRAGCRAGMSDPLWLGELAAGAGHFLDSGRDSGEAANRLDLIEQVCCALRELGQPVLALHFSQVDDSDGTLMAGTSPDSGLGLVERLVGPDLAELVTRGLIGLPTVWNPSTDQPPWHRVPHARLHLPGCPDAARALVRLVQTAAWCGGEIHLIGASLWLEELGMGPSRGLEAFDRLEEAAKALGRSLRLHLSMGPGSTPVQGQLGLFFFGNSQGLREPTLALENWLKDGGRTVGITGWIPSGRDPDNRDAMLAMSRLADLAHQHRPVRVVRHPQSPDLLAEWGAGCKPIDAILGTAILDWDSSRHGALGPLEIENLAKLAVRAGSRLRQSLRGKARPQWPHPEPASLWRMGWQIRFGGGWPAEILSKMIKVAQNEARSIELPLLVERGAGGIQSVLDARVWRSGTRLLPAGDGPWLLMTDQAPDPDLPGLG